jgi:uncharacterized phiE125 gp8 family phage protein
MGLVVTVAPTTEPLSLAEAKQHLRVDSTDQDTLIQSLITAARIYCEKHTRRTLAPATFRYTLDEFPACNRPVRLPVPPVSAVLSISYVDTDGNTQTLDPTGYHLDLDSEPARITPAFNTVWPATRQQTNAVTIQFTAGYSAVPDGLKAAMKLLIGAWYENRDAVTSIEVQELPEGVMGVDAILSQFSWGSYV